MKGSKRLKFQLLKRKICVSVDCVSVTSQLEPTCYGNWKTINLSALHIKTLSVASVYYIMFKIYPKTELKFIFLNETEMECLLKLKCTFEKYHLI